ncbi:MAG: DUF3253 domain-containing protein [Cyclobacterium sp.]|uniref:DUF3253 domain-containing protein n=1 Tax=Cyclobacterium sp. TaxID=1966343 RepID=UPI003970A3FD
MRDLQTDILVLATMEMAKRKEGSAFAPAEVVRWLYPNDWEHFMEEEMEAVCWLFQQGFLEIRQGGIPVDPNFLTEEPVTLIIK